MFLFFFFKKKEINNTNCSFSTRKIIPVIMFNILVINQKPDSSTLDSELHLVHIIPSPNYQGSLSNSKSHSIAKAS